MSNPRSTSYIGIKRIRAKKKSMGLQRKPTLQTGLQKVRHTKGIAKEVYNKNGTAPKFSPYKKMGLQRELAIQTGSQRKCKMRMGLQIYIVQFLG